MRQHLLLATVFATVVLTACSSGGGASKPDAGGDDPLGTTDGGRDGGGGDTRDGGGDEPDGGSTSVGIPPGGFNLDAGVANGTVTVDGVQVDPEGNIILGGGSTSLAFAWIANNSAGTVSKYDTRTGKEVGRYHAVIPVDGRNQPNGLRGNEGHNPSRTAVDLFGDVWVANRALGVQGSVTKIANSKAYCKERNGIEGIQTSEDKNDDGRIDPVTEMIIPQDWSNPAQYDECLLFSTPVGPSSTDAVKARAMAIGQGIENSAGDIWVGVWANSRLIKLDPDTGQQVPVNSAGAMDIPVFASGQGPYGAAIDRQQRLWMVSSSLSPLKLALVDTGNGEVVNIDGKAFISPPSSLGSSGAYGIAVDGQDRVWVAGWTSGPKAFRYTHQGLSTTLGQWAVFDFSSAISQLNTRMRRGRGIAADDRGFIWMSSDQGSQPGNPDATRNASQVIAFNGDTGALKKFQWTDSQQVDFIDATDGSSYTAIGVGLDADNNAWVNNSSGNVIRVDRESGAILRTQRQGSGLYTYSDFTGYQLRNFTAPSGWYRQVFTGCGANTTWSTATWDVEKPAGTDMNVYITVSNRRDGLEDPANRKGPFIAPPVDLVSAGFPKGNYLRIEFELKSTDRILNATPKLKSFDVGFQCEVIIR
ncbi:hypothetical protein [Myxococcus sp. RHSTA-1-4]|uniref:hypothetical protein n=1 Tax=Myxococcus sp. RHSTA-1-4 TaxID=2874601 RepID=UPI001CBDC1F7|nr:hypothetical protein [Myxococcus sp. RHSTA-1-4]MBZ4415953.1 hypothetical protein [Myxococcus sp. RHSTA-1-4]